MTTIRLADVPTLASNQLGDYNASNYGLPDEWVSLLMALASGQLRVVPAEASNAMLNAGQLNNTLKIENGSDGTVRAIQTRDGMQQSYRAMLAAAESAVVEVGE